MLWSIQAEQSYIVMYTVLSVHTMLGKYNFVTLLRDEHKQELEEELREISLVSDVTRIGEVRRREEYVITL